VFARTKKFVFLFLNKEKLIMTENSSKRKRLNEKNVLKIMSEWNHKSIDDFAEEFQVAPNTVRSMVYKIRKKHPELCPKKSRKTREHIIEAPFQMLKEVDQVTDN
jgi:hypothetical protein